MNGESRFDRNVVADRRWAFLLFNVVWWIFAGMMMAARISGSGWTIGAAGLFALFLILQAQAIYGFTIAMTGWWVLRHGGDAMRINQTLPPDDVPESLPPVAIIMPIFNEDEGRVFKGLQVMYESLRATGQADNFDFFVLSDSSDSNCWLNEERAWYDLCRKVEGFGHIYYRKRRMAQHHKSGNVADFCRRWGVRYEFVIVLDADSLMTGKTFVRLASLMARHPHVGIIQTFSRTVLGRTLFQRINQFGCNAYGPLFVAGANFWQLDNANFYGHNAILRIKPFMQYCAMPELPPSGKLGRRILSHDTVEGALIKRAGFDVWSDYDLEGSYEECPPDLLSSLQRDRRWCHGNMQHLWLLISPGLTIPSRLNILNGIMAYAGSPLWLLFLLFSPILFMGEKMPTNNFILFACTMTLLLVPKFLGALRMLASSQWRIAVGGRMKIILSVFAETIYSMILAPVLMLFYTEFVWSTFFGTSVGWGRQKRSDGDGPTWKQCIAAHFVHTILAIAAAVVVAMVAPRMLPWLALVLIGPLVAIPLNYLTASSKVGQVLKRHGWFLIPEEACPPRELQEVESPFEFAGDTHPSARAPREDEEFTATILDPQRNALHVSLLRERQRVSLDVHSYVANISNRLLREGPEAVPPGEKKVLLWDADAMQAIHQQLWCGSETEWHEWWRTALRTYKEELQTPPAN